MHDQTDLPSGDLKAFRRRFFQAQIGLTLLGLALLVLWATVQWSLFSWLVAIVVFSIASLALEYRGQKCPRCRGLVFGSIAEDVGGISLFGSPPERCKTCGVRLRSVESS